MATSPYANCPKCAATSAGRSICPACGLVFAKYRAPVAVAAVAPMTIPEPTGLERRYVQALGANLLPLIGVLAFGWSAAPALFLLWLDTLLCNLRILGPVLAKLWSITHVEVDGTKTAATPAFRIFGTPFLCLVICGPMFAVGVPVLALIEREQAARPLEAVLAAPGFWLFVAVAVAMRGYPILQRSREVARKNEPTAAFGAKIANELVNLLQRSMVIMMLAWLAQPLGHWGLVVFLALAAAFTSYVDLHEDWLGHLEKKARQWGEEHRARKRELESRK